MSAPDIDAALDQRRYAENIVRKLSEHHHTAYFAGGCVRDFLLSNPPNDFDVATSATPEAIQQIFGKSKTLLVGASFGVVCVHEKIRGTRFQVEVATFRNDGSYSDGRRPDSVVFSTPEEDAFRRDFTINGIFYDPIKQELIDFVGGKDDLDRRVIRAIGDPIARFTEDRLRLIRGVRFAARFQFALEEQTQAAIAELAPTLISVSPERITAELRKMLIDPHRVQAVSTLKQLGLLHVIHPELHQALRDDDVFDDLQRQLSTFNEPSFESVLAALFFPLVAPRFLADFAFDSQSAHRVDSQTVMRYSERLKDQLKLSNDEVEAMQFTWHATPLLLRCDQLRWSQLQPLLISPHILSALSFARSILVACERPIDRLDRCFESLSLPTLDLNPPPLVNGKMLIQQGINPSPLFTEYLKMTRDAQLNKLVSTPEQAMEWLNKEIARKDNQGNP